MRTAAPSIWPWRAIRAKPKVKVRRKRRRRKRPTDREYRRQQTAALACLLFAAVDNGPEGHLFTGGGIIYLAVTAPYTVLYAYHVYLNVRRGVPRSYGVRWRAAEAAINALGVLIGISQIARTLVEMFA